VEESESLSRFSLKSSSSLGHGRDQGVRRRKVSQVHQVRLHWRRRQLDHQHAVTAERSRRRNTVSSESVSADVRRSEPQEQRQGVGKVGPDEVSGESKVGYIIPNTKPLMRRKDRYSWHSH
jgi:hypothetical protein